MVSTQSHARIHAFATLLTILAAIYFRVSSLDIAILALAIGGVWTAEALNTALEFLVDLVHPEWDDKAGKIKDLAAGAVLLMATCALVVACGVFYPYILNM